MSVYNPMTQYITFKRDELTNNLEFIRNAMRNIEQQIVYIQEQGLGRRDNLDWQDVGARLREYFEDVRKGMNRFVPEVPFDSTGIKFLENKFIHEIKMSDNNDDLPF